MLKAWLRLRVGAEWPSELLAEGTMGSEEELLYAIGVVAVVVASIGGVTSIGVRLGGDGYVDDGRRDARGQGFHGAIERKQGADAVVIERGRGRGRYRRLCGVDELISRQ